MHTATRISQATHPGLEKPFMDFQSVFQDAPFAAACCNHEGLILAMNPALKNCLNPELSLQSPLSLEVLLARTERAAAQSLLHDLFSGNVEYGRIAADRDAVRQSVSPWAVWRLPVSGGEPPCAVLTAELEPPGVAEEETLLQAQRWEALGRLAGGVVHDFNNLLTGVMLYTDLLLSSIDIRDRRRRYADEIRSAVIQATGLVRQLLVFSRSHKLQPRSLSLNQVVQQMKDLLSRLIGESISLEFKLDSDLGLLKIDQSQAQQIILNLILNARDAMPNGGRIVVETSNCRFQSVAGLNLSQQGASAFPCILFAVSDDGCGMDENTRHRLFQPFFTTKSAGKGTGLGLTTVHSIVTAQSGLIHVDSEQGRGTRVMILFPRSSQTTNAVFVAPQTSSSQSCPKPFQVIQKGSLL
jgi:signal transduction histidine kinase